MFTGVNKKLKYLLNVKGDIFMNLTHNDIKKAVIKSQHCQRNWDLSKDISTDDLNLLVHAATNCPSKQNIAHYKVHFITNRNVIEDVHKNTAGFTNYKHNPVVLETNSQVLANLLIVFEAYDFKLTQDTTVFRNDETRDWIENKKLTSAQEKVMLRDQHMAVGVAAGYVNVIASMIGYSTGCCACFDPAKIKEIINAEDEILLLMGIGYPDQKRNRREHHVNDFVFPTKKKQPIIVNYID
jgi:nitroreductase